VLFLGLGNTELRSVLQDRLLTLLLADVSAHARDGQTDQRVAAALRGGDPVPLLRRYAWVLEHLADNSLGRVACGLSELESDITVFRALCARAGARLETAAPGPAGGRQALESPWVLTFAPDAAAKTAAAVSVTMAADAPSADADTSGAAASGVVSGVVSFVLGIDEGTLEEMHGYGRRMRQVAGSVVVSQTNRADVAKRLAGTGVTAAAAAGADAGAAPSAGAAAGVLSLCVVTNRRRRTAARAAYKRGVSGAVVEWLPHERRETLVA
jgi:hypothetical protein